MSGLSSHQIAHEIFAELLPYRRRFPDPILERHSEEQEVAAGREREHIVKIHPIC